jgi:hypothetical protein
VPLSACCGGEKTSHRCRPHGSEPGGPGSNLELEYGLLEACSSSAVLLLTPTPQPG